MKRLSFIIVPYLSTKGSFTFAGYQFVSLQDLQTCAEGSVLETARVIAGQYRNQMNDPIKKAAFVFPINKKLGEYLDDIIETEISDMLKALYLDGFCHMDQLNVVTAENFEAIFYDMLSDDYSLSTRSGGVFPQTFIGGDMKKASYMALPYVIVDRGNYVPSDMMSPALAHMVSNPTPSLLETLSFFFQAMRNDDRRTLLNRTTDLYMAFLKLMKTAPGGSERKLWWKNMLTISKPGLSTYPYLIIDTNSGSPTKDSPKNLNIVQIWGEEFYKLRCKMLHGDQLRISDFAFSDISGNNLVPNNPAHFYVGANVFPALFFYKFRQEYSNYPDPPNIVIDNKESFMSRNYTLLGFGNANYQLPFYVNDISLSKAILKTIKSHP